MVIYRQVIQCCGCDVAKLQTHICKSAITLDGCNPRKLRKLTKNTDKCILTDRPCAFHPVGMAIASYVATMTVTTKRRETMKGYMYSITFLTKDGEMVHSRYTETVRAARNWAKWLSKQHYIAEVFIHRGGHGGESVELGI